MDMFSSENRHLKLSRLFQKSHRWGQRGRWDRSIPLDHSWCMQKPGHTIWIIRGYQEYLQKEQIRKWIILMLTGYKRVYPYIIVSKIFVFGRKDHRDSSFVCRHMSQKIINCSKTVSKPIRKGWLNIANQKHSQVNILSNKFLIAWKKIPS